MDRRLLPPEVNVSSPRLFATSTFTVTFEVGTEWRQAQGVTPSEFKLCDGVERFVFSTCRTHCTSSRLHLGSRVLLGLRVGDFQAFSRPLDLCSKDAGRTARRKEAACSAGSSSSPSPSCTPLPNSASRTCRRKRAREATEAALALVLPVGSDPEKPIIGGAYVVVRVALILLRPEFVVDVSKKMTQEMAVRQGYCGYKISCTEGVPTIATSYNAFFTKDQSEAAHSHIMNSVFRHYNNAAITTMLAVYKSW
eukprot:m51a1_g9261 hypothetical protein (252) ;mRNA; f:65617-67154